MLSLLMIASADNYVTVNWLKENRLEKTMLRIPLKKVEEQLSPLPGLFRCHRSYLVNLGMVEKVSGNSQGYKLHLPHIDAPVPVARSVSRDLIRLVNGKA